MQNWHQFNSMNNLNLLSDPSVLKSKFQDGLWFPALALAASLYLIYSPVFLTDYLMN